MLFKGQFKLEVTSTIKNLFKDTSFSLKEKLEHSKDSENNVKMYKFIQNNCFDFQLNEAFEIYKFNFHKPIDINPDTMTPRDKDFSISFMVTSNEMSVLKIKGSLITFINSDNEKHTVTLHENIEIIKA